MLDYPQCADEEELVTFNKFGQPVCHCASDTYPLEDPFSVQDIPGQKKCYKIGEKGPCPYKEALDLPDYDDSSGLLKCGRKNFLVALSAFSGPTIRCSSGKVFVFNSCRPG